MIPRRLILPLGVLFAIACDSDSGDHHDEVTLQEDACEHFTEGPFQAVNAGMDEAGAGDVSGEHVDFQITFVDLGNGRAGGVVQFEQEAAEEIAIFLDAEIDFTLTTATGDTLVVEETEVYPSFCNGKTLERHTFDLEVGLHRIHFDAPAGTAGVNLVFLPGAEDHEHED